MATITINFSTNNNPTNGYIVKYRQVGTIPYTTVTPNPTGSPILITGVGSGLSYEGTIQADCGNGQYGSVSTFNVTASAMFMLSRDPSSATNACALTNRNFIFYSPTAVLNVNEQVYVDAALSVAYTTPGYFSDGTKVYQISDNGKVLSVANCVLV